MSTIRYTAVAFAFLFSFYANAFPLAKVNGFETFLPPSFTPNYDFEGIVKLSNCSGSLIRLEGALDTDKGLILSNGHCVEGGFPQPGQYIYGRASTRRFQLMSTSSAGVANLWADMLLYATMTGTDMSLYRVTETYGEILQRYGIHPLNLASTHPEPGTPIEVISGYWRRGYSCGVEAFAFQLSEGGWTMNDSIRYSRPGCEVIGGTSGSPIVQQGTRTVIGVNNTINESGGRCTMNNPCEIDQAGNVSFTRGIGYGQQTYLLYSCLNANREVDLTIAGCALFH